MYHQLKEANAKEVSKTFWRRLVWRDLAYWQLWLFPRMRNHAIRAHYAGMEWRDDPALLKAWQRGVTGYPLVDAGMRELWATGWMHQNIRMVVAVFLTEICSISWVEGERWFHETLVDADLAINAMMWQNAGKTGLDPWNFTMNPAGSTQDPHGEYVRQWCPELQGLPKHYIHSPWEALPGELSKHGVVLGENYPVRVGPLNLKQARAENAGRIRAARKGQESWIDEGGYDLLCLPHGATANGLHDGCKFRVFTKPDIRNPSGKGGGSSSGAPKGPHQKPRGSGGASAAGRGGGHRVAVGGFQATLDEYVARAS